MDRVVFPRVWILLALVATTAGRVFHTRAARTL